MESAETGTDSMEVTAADGVSRAPRRQRFDAKRNMDNLLSAAKSVFASSGVDAPAKEITDLAGVGVGTLYRHFPERSDLVKAVLAREIEACAEAGLALCANGDPGAALQEWLLRYTEFLATKDGLASAMNSGRAAFDAVRNHIVQRLEPILATLLQRAALDGDVRSDVTARQLLYAVAKLCMPVEGESVDDSRRMVGFLLDGLRHGAKRDQPSSASTESST